jgi:hypothetical protein
METASPATIQRALKLLEYQQRASKSYYARNKESIKAKSIQYWENNREAINARRRERYRKKNPIPPPENPPLE